MMTGDRKKVTISEADNGWIISVDNHGESMMREPYQKSLLVFNDPADLVEWFDKFFDMPIKVKEFDLENNLEKTVE